MPDPLPPVHRVGLDLRKEAASDRLRQTLALLPGSYRVDVNPEEPRKNCLARAEQFPHALTSSDLETGGTCGTL